MTAEPAAPSLRVPTAFDADVIISWSGTAEETTRWCSSWEHPVPLERMLGWWDDPEIEPWALTGSDGRLIGYGELWLDPEEDEVELARLILAPDMRGRGLGRQLVLELKAKASKTGLATTILRVVPDNETAIRCYLASGFEQLRPEESAVWNEGQPREYVWMTARGDPRRLPR